MAGQARAWGSVRAKMLLIVSVCLLPALTESIIALASLASVNANVVDLSQHSVKSLAALADLRDMEGDTRVLVHEYLTATGSEHAQLRAEVADTDAEADHDVADYQEAHGSRSDSVSRLMAEFVVRFQTYRRVRDDQVFRAADQGHLAQATATVTSALSDADDAMAVPLDAVFAQDLAASAGAQRQAGKAYDRARIGVGLVLLLGLLVAGFAAWRLTRGMLSAIGGIRTVMTSGDRSVRVGQLKDDGELAELGAAIDAMLDSLAEQDAVLSRDQATREQQLRAAYVRQQLSEQEVRRRAQMVIDETASTVLSELQDVVAQAEAVLAAGRTIEDRLSTADQVTRGVVDQAREADRVVAAVGESLKRVGGIANLIAGVAAQTNLLALNATIEAARAGEAGKGFSVVASEVKGLAAQTASSTSEITATVGNLEGDAAAMSDVITAMADGVKGIDDATAQVSEVAAEQRATVARLDASVRAALARIESMSQLTEGLERRNQERVNLTGTVQLRAGGRTIPSHLRDLSESGLRCSKDPSQRLALGSRVEVELQLGDETQWVPTTVVRIAAAEQKGDDDDLGLQIDQNSRPALAFVRRYLAAVTQSQRVTI